MWATARASGALCELEKGGGMCRHSPWQCGLGADHIFVRKMAPSFRQLSLCLGCDWVGVPGTGRQLCLPA